MVSGAYSRVDRNIFKLEELLKKADGSLRPELEKVVDDLKKIREKPIQDPEDEESAETRAASLWKPTGLTSSRN